MREERPGDEKRIYQLNFQAFERKEEAEVVDALRAACPQFVSLVAEAEGRIIGHILFTPAVIEGGAHPLCGSCLAPVAVLPERQRQGVGSALVQAGLEAAKKAGEPFIVVVGHPAYYPRFGFEQASQYGIRCEYAEVPDEAFMIHVFEKDTLRGVTGTARMRPEFAAAL